MKRGSLQVLNGEYFESTRFNGKRDAVGGKVIEGSRRAPGHGIGSSEIIVLVSLKSILGAAGEE